MTRILLVRHGHVEGIAPERFRGRHDVCRLGVTDPDLLHGPPTTTPNHADDHQSKISGRFQDSRMLGFLQSTNMNQLASLYAETNQMIDARHVSPPSYEDRSRAAINGLVEALLDAAPDTRWMRDATRGGLGTVANELARATDHGVILDEAALPIRSVVLAACDLLGIDPLYVANEGKFVAVVPTESATAAVAALRSTPGGAYAAVIGEIVAEPPGVVAMRTAFGGTRIVDMLVGDPLPRIC